MSVEQFEDEYGVRCGVVGCGDGIDIRSIIGDLFMGKKTGGGVCLN